METFKRNPVMNSWHLAQALLANSPLEPAVIKMMNESNLTDFYKELVENGQNGGVSMHSIYQSEIDHLYTEKSRSICGATANVLFGQATRINANSILNSLNTIDLKTAASLRMALHLAANNLPLARILVNSNLSAEPDNGYWKVQDLLLQYKETNRPLGQLNATEQTMLLTIAAEEKEGTEEALAWLDLMGVPFRPEIVLPNTSKSRKHVNESALDTSPFLRAFPNPSNGPVYLVYEVPDGAEQADVQVVDASGKLVFTRNLAPQSGILEPPQFSTGLHIATLRCDGIRIGAVKLSMVK